MTLSSLTIVSVSGPAIEWKRLPFNNLSLPAYQSAGAAGFDIQACLITSAEDLARWTQDPRSLDLVLDAPNLTGTGRTKALVSTRWQIAIPPNHELQIRPRSGLSAKYSVIILNSPGTVDEDYRGEIIIAMQNLGSERLVIHHGMRIAQAVLAPVVRATHIEVNTLSETARGASGFGSTGM